MKLTKEKNEIMFRIEIVNFIIQTNLPFRIAASQTNFTKHITYAHKTTDILKFKSNDSHPRIVAKCLSQDIKQGYLKLMEETPYSISIDEGSAKGKAEF